MMCDWSGKALTLKSDGKVIAAGDKTLRDQILKLLS